MNVEAVQIALDNGAQIQFDTVVISPYFTYVRDSIEHEVLFEAVLDFIICIKISIVCS